MMESVEMMSSRRIGQGRLDLLCPIRILPVYFLGIFPGC